MSAARDANSGIPLNLLDLAEPLLPGALKRTRHQPVLRLHGIVLPAGPLRLVMGPLAPERPLALQQAGLFLKLAPSGDGQGEPIRRQRRQRQALYRGVDRQGSDLLATRPAVLLPVGGTLIYGVVAARPGIAQTHAPAAPTANYDPLQQRLAFAGHARPASFISVEVVCKPPLVCHELLPADARLLLLFAKFGELRSARSVMRYLHR